MLLWMLLWLIVTSLVLLALTIVLWSFARALTELREDIALGRSTDRQHDAADLWRRESRYGIMGIRRQVAATVEPKPLEPERTHPMTLEERANLIDQRARESYYHGAYCGEVPKVALQHLQEAVAEAEANERERCATIVDLVASAPAVKISDIAAAIRHRSETGGP